MPWVKAELTQPVEVARLTDMILGDFPGAGIVEEDPRSTVLDLTDQLLDEFGQDASGQSGILKVKHVIEQSEARYGLAKIITLSLADSTLRGNLCPTGLTFVSDAPDAAALVRQIADRVLATFDCKEIECGDADAVFFTYP